MQLLSKETPALTQVVYPPSRGERDGVLGRQPFPQPFLLTCYRLPSVGAICIRPVVGKSPPLSYREHPSTGKYAGARKKTQQGKHTVGQPRPWCRSKSPRGFPQQAGGGGRDKVYTLGTVCMLGDGCSQISEFTTKELIHVIKHHLFPKNLLKLKK